MAEDDTCPICLDKFTASVRKAVTCGQCRANTCSKCVEKYLLNTIEDPHCPHCRYAWPRSFLNTVCTSTFLNKTYYKYRQDILMNRERSFLPQMMVFADREMRARKVDKLATDVSKEELELRKEYEKKFAELSSKRTRLWQKAQNIRSGRDEAAAGGAGAATEAKAEARKFVRRCTATDCKGFLSSVWKCGVCDNWVCPDCFEVKGRDKDTQHTCKPEMLETANLIKKDTKPCPSCGEMIMKSEGCDQMWCTSCHTPFSWVTGKVVTTGIIHNPHYYQWMRNGGGGQMPQHPGFIPCGGLPDPYNLRRTLRNLSDVDSTEFLAIYRTCVHMIEVERTRYERHVHPQNNQDLDVRYLMNELDEEDWKAALARDEKDRQKSREIREILDAFNGATIDIMRRIEIRPANPYLRHEGLAIVLEIRTELNALREYIIGELMKVSKAFNCSVPYIDDDWNVKHGSAQTIRRHAKEAVAAAEVPILAPAVTPARGGAGAPIDG